MITIETIKLIRDNINNLVFQNLCFDPQDLFDKYWVAISLDKNCGEKVNNLCKDYTQFEIIEKAHELCKEAGVILMVGPFFTANEYIPFMDKMLQKICDADNDSDFASVQELLNSVEVKL
jgi:hypothetical protein